MLLRLAYLGITNAFALVRLFSRSDRGKDAEILALRHQLAVLQRQLGGQRVRFGPADRAWLAALLHHLPRPGLRRLRLLVQPDTILRWCRDLLGPPPRGQVAASPARPTSHGAFDPCVGAASGSGEPLVGLPACAWAHLMLALTAAGAYVFDHAFVQSMYVTLALPRAVAALSVLLVKRRRRRRMTLNPVRLSRPTPRSSRPSSGDHRRNDASAGSRFSPFHGIEGGWLLALSDRLQSHGPAFDRADS
jgi:hypothetical protein